MSEHFERAVNHLTAQVKSDAKELRGLLVQLFGQQQKPPARLIVLQFGADEPINKKGPMLVTLKKPIKPGFKRPFTLTTDESVDVRADGTFFTAEAVEGDSTIEITTQDSKSAAGFVRGDGALGTKLNRIKADGHVGTGEVEITLDVAFEVNSPDATEFGFVEGGPDVPV